MLRSQLHIRLHSCTKTCSSHLVWMLSIWWTEAPNSTRESVFSLCKIKTMLKRCLYQSGRIVSFVCNFRYSNSTIHLLLRCGMRFGSQSVRLCSLRLACFHFYWELLCYVENVRCVYVCVKCIRFKFWFSSGEAREIDLESFFPKQNAEESLYLCVRKPYR